jgi:hypothetical protein
MGPGHDLDLGVLKSAALQHGSQFVWSVHEVVLGDQRSIRWGAVAIQFLVPDIQRGSAPVVAPGSESDAAASPEYPPHLTECRLRLGNMEQYERHDHSVI